MNIKKCCNTFILTIGLFLICFSCNDKKKIEKADSKRNLFLSFKPGITISEYERTAKADSLLTKCDSIMPGYCYYYKLKNSTLVSYLTPTTNDTTRLLEGLFLHGLTLKRGEMKELINWHVEKYGHPNIFTELHTDSITCWNWKLDHKLVKLCIDSFEDDGRNYNFEIYHEIDPSDYPAE